MKTKAEKLLVENSQLRAQLSEARQKLESEVGRRECAHARPLHKNDSNVLSARARKWLAHRSVKFVPSMTFYLANRCHYSCFVSGIRWILPRKFLAKGASIYYVRKIFGIPPCSQSGLIYKTKFTQPPLLHSHFGQIF